jgi:hypothetical protein
MHSAFENQNRRVEKSIYRYGRSGAIAADQLSGNAIQEVRSYT